MGLIKETGVASGEEQLYTLSQKGDIKYAIIMSLLFIAIIVIDILYTLLTPTYIKSSIPRPFPILSSLTSKFPHI